MAEPARGEPEGQVRRDAGRTALALTLLFVLAAITVSAGLVVYTAWLHDSENGPFAVLFAVLSSKAALSWLAWKDQDLHEQRRAGDGPKQT
ncbi:MAG: hypothetical protein CYG60_22915 [Actinobacteria bacterium]|nr:hypothetical protein [Actinomycetota bacterium]PLS83036.1 MAG: hypothetical protein CYG60_22915 [Actinomycetota bacterium]